MRWMQIVAVALSSLPLAGGNAVAGSAIDWSKAKPIVDEGVGWGVIPLENGKVAAFFGRPESDYVVVRMSCAKGRALSLSYIDSTMTPHAKHRVHLRIGGQEVDVPGSTGDRWEMDDLVELRFSAPSMVYENLRAGGDLQLFASQVGGSWTASFALPGDAKALAPFFASCAKE